MGIALLLPDFHTRHFFVGCSPAIRFSTDPSRLSTSLDWSVVDPIGILCIWCCQVRAQVSSLFPHEVPLETFPSFAWCVSRTFGVDFIRTEGRLMVLSFLFCFPRPFLLFPPSWRPTRTGNFLNPRGPLFTLNHTFFFVTCPPDQLKSIL